MPEKWTDETAEWYAEKYGEYPTNQLTIEALVLEPDAVIVDIGCGTGAALRHASQQVTTGRLIGIDPVPRMVEIAYERLEGHPASERIEFRQGTASPLPVGDDEADVVLAFDSFDHWEKKDEGLQEVRRVLRAGGVFVVVKDTSIPGGEDAKQAFRDALARNGFDVTSEQDIQRDDLSFTMWSCAVASP